MVIMQFLFSYSGDTQEPTSNVKLTIKHQHAFTALSKNGKMREWTNKNGTGIVLLSLLPDY